MVRQHAQAGAPTLHAAEAASAAPCPVACAAFVHADLHRLCEQVLTSAGAMCRCGERLPSTWGATQSRWRET